MSSAAPGSTLVSVKRNQLYELLASEIEGLSTLDGLSRHLRWFLSAGSRVDEDADGKLHLSFARVEVDTVSRGADVQGGVGEANGVRRRAGKGDRCRVDDALVGRGFQGHHRSVRDAFELEIEAEVAARGVHLVDLHGEYVGPRDE